MKNHAVATLQSAKSKGELSIRNVLTEGLRLLQVIGGHVPDDLGDVYSFDEKCKLSALSDVLEELGDRQAVIWCAFVPEVKMLSSWLEKQTGAKVSVLFGGMSDQERFDNLETFRNKKTQWFVGTSAAGGTGINQLVGADTCIYYSRNFSLTDYLQSQDRCHRIGTISPVTIIKLIAQGTIDEKIDQALDQKKDVLEMMLAEPEKML